MTAGPGVSDALEQDGRVLRARVARGRHGTLDGDALPLLADALSTLDPASVGAVLLVSESSPSHPTNFCTGGDVRSFAAAPDRGAFVGELATTFHGFLRAVVDCPVPVVAAVTGWAAGAGMSIVCAVDLAVGGHGTTLRPAYPGIGFSPDGGMTWTLPRIVGAGRARHILLTDRVLDARAALDLGILTTVVDDGEVRAEAERTAHRLAHGPTAALGRIKRLLGSSPDLPLAAQLEAEAGSIAACAAGPEGAEGLAAFTEKRPPSFR